jgi:hypothetical protein
VAYDLTGKIKLIQDAKNIRHVDSLKVGQEVTVTFDIRGREYNGRYFSKFIWQPPLAALAAWVGMVHYIDTLLSKDSNLAQILVAK